MTKQEAAERLGIGVRTLERYTQQGRIQGSEKRGKTRPVLDYDEVAVEALKAALEREANPATITPNRTTSPNVANPATALARLPQQAPQALERVEVISPNVARNSPIPPTVPEKLVWTLEEAALMTGFSRQRLRAAIEAGDLKAGRVGRAFRLRPDDVRAWVNGLF